MVFAPNRRVIVVEHVVRLAEDSEVDIDQQLRVRIVATACIVRVRAVW